MFLFLLVFSIRISQSGFTEKGAFYLSYGFKYGFEQGGSYVINITKANVNSLLILITTKKDSAKFRAIANKSLCNSKYDIDYITVLHLNNGSGFISGQIHKKGIYYTTIMTCYANTNSNFYFDIIYKNPNSMIGYDEQKYLITNHINSVILCLLAIYWLICWFCNFTLNNSLHLLYTVGFIFLILEQILYFNENNFRIKSNEQYPLFNMRVFFGFLKNIFFIFSCLLAGNGFKINNTISIIRIIIIFLLSGGIATFTFIDPIHFNFNFNSYLFIFADICTILIALFFKRDSKTESFLKLVASLFDRNEHLYFSMLNEYVLILYSSTCSFFYIYDLYIFSLIYLLYYPACIAKLIYNIINLFAILLIVYLFKMDKIRLNGYKMDNVPYMISV